MSVIVPSNITPELPSSPSSRLLLQELPLLSFRRSDGVRPRLLYVSTLDRIISVMFPHLEAARAAGWEIDIACQPTVYQKDLAQYADRVFEVPLKRFPLHPRNGAALQQLVKIIRAEDYSIIHCHNPTGGFIGRLAATLAKTGAKRVYTAHGFHFHREGGAVSNAIYRSAETIAGHWWSDAVLTITREDYDAAHQGRVVPQNRLFLTGGVGVSAREDFNPSLVSTQAVDAVRAELRATTATLVVTMVGELIPRKRHRDTILAFAKVRERHPEAILVLVGDGVLMDSLQQEARTLGIEQQVRFLGFRRDVPTILAATDVFLFPSKQEGLPCAVQEALSMCVPVVATDVRGCRDIVDSACGRLVPLGDISAQAEAVSHLLSLTPEKRRDMGRVGREKMLEIYDREACVRQWQEIYCQILTSGRQET